MAWFRLTAGASLAEVSTPPSSRAFHAATRGLFVVVGALAGRLRLGLPAFVDDGGAGIDREGLVSLGIEVVAVDGPPPTLVATDDTLASAWAGLRGWLEAHAPEPLGVLAGPALAVDVEQLEARIGATLPADLRALWALHDGQTSDGGPFDWTFESVLRSLSVKLMLDEMFPRERAEELPMRVDPGVRAVWWSHGWVPFTSNGSGDHLCVDLDPAPRGRRGQVIEHRHDHDRRILVAPSVAEWVASVHPTLTGTGAPEEAPGLNDFG
jgi:cell wall assembly regulator SMI1